MLDDIQEREEVFFSMQIMANVAVIFTDNRPDSVDTSTDSGINVVAVDREKNSFGVVWEILRQIHAYLDEFTSF